MGSSDPAALRAAAPAMRRELRALLAVVRAVTGPEAVQPECCWGYDVKTRRCRCRLHRAIEGLRAPRRGGKRRTKP
jgi:hypothetical protein